MKIVFPVAGDSTRFKPRYQQPKYIIDIKGKLMIEWALAYIDYSPEELVFIIRIEHEKEYGVSRILRNRLGSGITIIEVGSTEGPSHTVYYAKDFLQNERVLIRDCDCITQFSNLREFLDKTEVDGVLGCYKVNIQENPNYWQTKSFALIDKSTNRVLDIKEKKIISDTIICGNFFFKQSDNFFDCFHVLRNQNRKTKGEYYVSQIMEDLIQQGKKVEAIISNHFVDLGTAELLEQFLNHP